MRILAIIAEVVSALFASVPAHVAHNCDEYGEELAWMGAGEMDGFELHEPDMRRDRVHRHPEASATFPAGDVA